MITPSLPFSRNKLYRCQKTIDFYKSSQSDELVTQVAAGRLVYLLSYLTPEGRLEFCSCEDNYRGWLTAEDLQYLDAAGIDYHPPMLARPEIEQRIPEIIAFTVAAMDCPNYYRWGGTVAPNYDCSGLMQAAFSASGIWLPRDSYQQAEFAQPIEVEELQPGDLLFFKKAERVSHVALYLGEGKYIHSSGKESGRDGIGIDELSAEGDEVSRVYYAQFCGAGRVMESYINPDFVD